MPVRWPSFRRSGAAARALLLTACRRQKHEVNPRAYQGRRHDASAARREVGTSQRGQRTRHQLDEDLHASGVLLAGAWEGLASAAHAGIRARGHGVAGEASRLRSFAARDARSVLAWKCRAFGCKVESGDRNAHAAGGFAFPGVERPAGPREAVWFDGNSRIDGSALLRRCVAIGVGHGFRWT